MVSTVLSLGELEYPLQGGGDFLASDSACLRGEVGNCMHVACARIAAMDRPIACGSDIFLALTLLAASPDCQSRRVAILDMFYSRRWQYWCVRFSSDYFCIWCVYLAPWKNQDPGCIYGMFLIAERRIQEVYSSSILSWLFVPWKKSNGWMSTYLA